MRWLLLATVLVGCGGTTTPTLTAYCARDCTPAETGALNDPCPPGCEPSPGRCADSLTEDACVATPVRADQVACSTAWVHAGASGATVCRMRLTPSENPADDYYQCLRYSCP